MKLKHCLLLAALIAQPLIANTPTQKKEKSERRVVYLIPARQGISTILLNTSAALLALNSFWKIPGLKNRIAQYNVRMKALGEQERHLYDTGWDYKIALAIATDERERDQHDLHWQAERVYFRVGNRALEPWEIAAFQRPRLLIRSLIERIMNKDNREQLASSARRDVLNQAFAYIYNRNLGDMDLQERKQRLQALIDQHGGTSTAQELIDAQELKDYAAQEQKITDYHRQMRQLSNDTFMAMISSNFYKAAFMGSVFFIAASSLYLIINAVRNYKRLKMELETNQKMAQDH